MNALKHGGYASTPVIPTGPLAEDPEAYEAFRAGVKTSLEIGSPLEEELAERIATLMWRARRPAAYEATFISTGPTSAPFDALTHAEWLHDWNLVAARVLRDPEGPHEDQDLEDAAVAAGHVAHLDMEDSWPQPRPRSAAEWNNLIDSTLARAGKSREEAAAISEEIVHRSAVTRARLMDSRRVSDIARLIEDELLLKTSRVESHLSRELSRHISILRAIQSDRRETASKD